MLSNPHLNSKGLALKDLPEDVIHMVNYIIARNQKATWIIVDMVNKLPDWTARFSRKRYCELAEYIHKTGHSCFLIHHNRKIGYLVHN